MRSTAYNTAALALVACASAAPQVPTPVGSQDGSSEQRVESYSSDRSSITRFYPVDAAPERSARLTHFAEEQLAELRSVEFDGLGLQGKIDHVLLRTELEYELAVEANRTARLERLAPFLPFVDRIMVLETARWRVEPVDPRAAAKTLDELAKEVEGLSERIALNETIVADDAGDADEPEEDALLVSAVDAVWIADRVRSVHRALGEWYRHYDAYMPEFRWWCEEAYDELRQALSDYGVKLREEVAGQKGEDDDPLVGDPIGRDALLRDLRHEFIPNSPEELLLIGEAQFQWCEGEMARAAKDLGFDDWHTALAAVKELHVPPGQQDALVANQAREAIAWLDELDLVTIPELCRETWRVRMISRDRQRLFPFAAYGGQRMDVAYPTADMDHDAKLMALRGNNVHFTRAVTPHELIPGHHLQGFMAQRYATHRRAFSTPFLTEGWALYWEMLEWELGWPKTAEDRVGMLFWRSHRAARIVVSLNFHLGLMTPEEMIDYLVDRVGHERDGATAEVRRYIGGGYGPLYQCAYMVGGLQLMALKTELVDSGRMTYREFHDAVLQQGSMPIEMIRAALTGETPARDHVASWDFGYEWRELESDD